METTGQLMSKEAFLDLLTMLYFDIERGASMEGSLRYEWATEPDHYVVAAALRTGNDRGGQGGIMIARGDTEFPSFTYEREQAEADARRQEGG